MCRSSQEMHTRLFIRDAFHEPRDKYVVISASGMVWALQAKGEADARLCRGRSCARTQTSLTVYLVFEVWLMI